MTLPTPETFFREVERVFGFLVDHGFTIAERESRPTYDCVVFLGRHVAVEISTDRRDECVDFAICKVVDGKSDVPRRNLFGYYVDRKGYRGGLKEFASDSAAARQDPFVALLEMEARGLRELAPEVVADRDDIFKE